MVMRALSPTHRSELEGGSAIDPAVIAERGYVTLEYQDRDELVTCGFHAQSEDSFPGLLMPMFRSTGELISAQFKPAKPIMIKAKPVKYLSPRGGGNHLDVHPRNRASITDITIPLWITEGIKKGDSLTSRGCCVVTLTGVFNWRGKLGTLGDWEDVPLKGRDVVLCFDADVWTNMNVARAMVRLGRWCQSKGAKRVRYLIVPHEINGRIVKGVDDYFAAGGALGALEAAATATEPDTNTASASNGVSEKVPSRAPVAVTSRPSSTPSAPSTLTDTIAVFRRWLFLSDPAPLNAVAATLVANLAPGDPVWLLLVCAPSTGKTEILSAATRLPWVIPAAKVTEASLLSGTPKRERAKDATGGLLRQIGDFGVLLCKDFTSVLAQNRVTSAEALAALREIYDGEWHRPVGTDGGKVLSWRGKCGLIGGVTPALDQYGQVVSALGDRFVLLRMPDADVDAFGVAALRHGEQERQMRLELREALAGLVERVDLSLVNRPRSMTEQARLIGHAAYTARSRTAVVRDGYRQDVQFLPQVEGPGRLVKAYARLLGGLETIGCDERTAWATLTRIAIDCAPALRTRVIRVLMALGKPTRTSQIATAIETGTKTASRYLEDLSILKLADRTKGGADDNSADLWQASSWLREYWPEGKSETEKYPPLVLPQEPEGEIDDGHVGHGDKRRTPGGTSQSHPSVLSVERFHFNNDPLGTEKTTTKQATDDDTLF